MAGAHSLALPSGYALRRATLRDVHALYRLEKIIFPRDAYPYFDLLLLFLAPGVVNLKVAAPDGTLAGYISAGPGLARRRAWIIMVGVAPRHRRRGVGACLLLAAEARFRRRTMYLTVRESNAPAIRLYRRMGYAVIERRTGYYRDGEAGLIMAKPRP